MGSRSIEISKMGLLDFTVLSCLAAIAAGHGTLWKPVSRSSAWRQGWDTPVNWNDIELNCGGFGEQWDKNGGKCGPCGDDYSDSRPLANYTMGQKLKIEVELDTNHLGYMEFRICKNNDINKYIDQECLDEHLLELADGSGTRFHVDDPRDGMWNVDVILPQGLTCRQCVMQWHYYAGNSWGDCEDGSEGMGCGPQETFRSCADIGIY